MMTLPLTSTQISTGKFFLFIPEFNFIQKMHVTSIMNDQCLNVRNVFYSC